MTVVLLILGVGALIGFIAALSAGQKPKEALGSAAGGAFAAGGCLIQLLIPALILVFSLFLLRLIFG